jgi:thioredoxin reductase
MYIKMIFHLLSRSHPDPNCKTGIPRLSHLFVAGDVCDYIYRHAVTAAGAGCKAAIDVIKYPEARQSVL